MNKSILLGLLSVAALLFHSGCATKPMLAYDLNPEVDVSSFETFALMPLPERVKGARPDALQRYGAAAEAAMRDGLIEKGYREVPFGQADFAINLKAAVSPRLNVSQWGYTTGNYAGTDYWGTSSYYEVVADVDITPEDHAIVVLEIYENKEKTLAWCSWMVDRTKKNRMPVEDFKELLQGMLVTFPAK